MLNATPLEFRFRYVLHGVIYALAFWSPWNGWLHLDPPGPNTHVWGLLSTNLYQTGWMGIDAAFNVLLAVAIALALLSAGLRTWGGAYLGAPVVQDSAMHTAGAGILTDGPFRHLRNPLYLGTFLHTFALALLMPRSGAIFAIVLIGLFQLRLILSEETFLRGKLGAPYDAYCALVPRIVPAIKPRVAATGQAPRWGQAFVGEAYFWIVAGSFAFAGWQYNAMLLIRCVVVAFGVSLVLKALTPKVA